MNSNLNNIDRYKIELISCPHDCENIKSILADINIFFHEAELYQYNKEYLFSIASLKKAFEKTFELKGIAEQECAKFFRMVIIESLKNIHKELKKMTSGFFQKRHYLGSYLEAEETLQLFKKGGAPAGKLRNMIHTSAAAVNPKNNLSTG